MEHYSAALWAQYVSQSIVHASVHRLMMSNNDSAVSSPLYFAGFDEFTQQLGAVGYSRQQCNLQLTEHTLSA